MTTGLCVFYVRDPLQRICTLLGIVIQGRDQCHEIPMKTSRTSDESSELAKNVSEDLAFEVLIAADRPLLGVRKIIPGMEVGKSRAVSGT